MGLGEDSRIKKAYNKYTSQDYYSARIIDVLSIISYQLSGGKAEKPKLLIDLMTNEKKETDIKGFRTIEEFNVAMQRKNKELNERS